MVYIYYTVYINRIWYSLMSECHRSPEQQAEGLRRQPSEMLEGEILTLAGQINAADYRLIKLLDEFDDNNGWQGDGIKSFAHWLNWKIGMGHMMARKKVRVAKVLRVLPMIDRAFANGEISYSKVRAMTRVATHSNEQFLLQIAEYGTAQHVEYLVKKYRLAKRLNEPLEEFENWRRQKGCLWHQGEAGLFVFDIRLPPEDGMMLVKAINRVADQLRDEQRGEQKGE